MKHSVTRSRLGLIASGVLLAANAIVPAIWGDVYPFTSAPMFRDAPRQFCNHRVFSASGQELDPADWLLQRIYDGNPVGYGVGVRPPPVLEQRFGIVPDEATVRRHFREQFGEPRHGEVKAVTVVQDVIGPIDSQKIGVVSTISRRVERE